MTTRRVLISPTSSSPLQVAVSGVDAAGASFDSLIFDANQPPMRLALSGWGRVPYTAYGDNNILQWSRLAVLPSMPAGTTPLFMVMGYQPDATNPGSEGAYINGRSPWGTMPYFNTTSGIGGAVGDGYFTGISFMKQTAASTPNFTDQTHIAYAIFRNAQ